MKQTTLLFLLKPESNEILLAMKKRGFGAGKYNGVGGKVKDDETIQQAAVREAEEEIGVVTAVQDIVSVANISFSCVNKPEFDLHCAVFTTTVWNGEPVESEEMAPRWFQYDEIPYAEMWVDDSHWLPKVLKGERLEAVFKLSEDGSAIVEETIVVVNG